MNGFGADACSGDTVRVRYVYGNHHTWERQAVGMRRSPTSKPRPRPRPCACGCGPCDYPVQVAGFWFNPACAQAITARAAANRAARAALSAPVSHELRTVFANRPGDARRLAEERPGAGRGTKLRAKS